ncbi:MAG: ROK family transcriptional regulator [bacterium]
MRAINIRRMHETNISLVLNTIRTNDGISRYEISKLTKLSPSAVSNIIDLLVKVGFVVEGPGETKGAGRRPIRLSLNDSMHFPIGIEIESDKITGVLINLVGDVIKQVTEVISPEIDYKEILTRVADIYFKLSKDFKYDQIMGLGVAIPGIVDSKNGVSIFSENLGWYKVPVLEFLKREIDVPIFIEQNIRAVTLGELWYGAGIGKNNIICVRVGSGVSAGFVINGSIYRGSTGIVGEFGHTVVELDGNRCRCGGQGCLESYVSTQVLINKVLEGLKNRVYSQVSLKGKNRDEMLEEIISAGKRGDRFILNIFEEMGRYLGIGISNLINLFNPEIVVIAGGLAKAEELLLEPVIRTVKCRVFPPIPEFDIPEITISKLGAFTCAIGAGTFVIEDIFLHPKKKLQREKV